MQEPYRYLIQTEEDFGLLLGYLEESQIFAWDTETNGKNNERFRCAMVGMSFGFEDFGCYIPFTHITEERQLELPYCAERLRPIFENPLRETITHNAKFDEFVLSRHGIDVRTLNHDTFTMAYLLREDLAGEGNEGGRRGLKPLVHRFCGYKMVDIEDATDQKNVAKKNRDYNFARVPLEIARIYASDDAYWLYKLFHTIKPLVEQQKLWPSYNRIERPLNRVVRDMEALGILVDQSAFENARIHYPALAEKYEARIYELAGEVFNIGSGPQLGPILFDKLKIGKRVPKTARGQYSTSEKTLRTYKENHEIVDLVLKWKKVRKATTTFVDGLEKFILEDGRVHARFNPTGTVTGRFSSQHPNMQQVTGDAVEDLKLRDFYVAPEGFVLCQADYSQVELRVMAHLAKDDAVIAAFLRGTDFHTEAARGVFGLTMDEEVTHRQRFIVKSINFGIPYGRGEQSLGELMGLPARCGYWNYAPWVPPEDRRYKSGEKEGQRKYPCTNCAKCFIERWFDNFKGVRILKKEVTERAMKYGYIRTMAGRKRRVPDVRSTDKAIAARAKRQAFNTYIQGSAGDIIKASMVQMAPELAELNSGIVLQIHDELLVEAPEEYGEDVCRIMKHNMENPINGKNPLILPLVTKPIIVKKWGDAK